MALYGIFARTQGWRAYLTYRLSDVLPSTFPDADRDGWIRSDDAVLFADEAVWSSVDDDCAILIDASAAVAAEIGAVFDHQASSLSTIDGAFAAFRLDRRRGILTMVRDKFGEQRIFYRDEGRFVIFSTDAVALFDAEVFPCAADPASAAHYIAFGHAIRGHTLRQGVRAVPAATSIEVTADLPLRFVQYFSPLGSQTAHLDDETLDRRLDDALTAACEDLRHFDRPGLLLSGGLDSSLIAHRCHRLGIPLRTYTIEYQALSDKAASLNEADQASAFAAHLGLSHCSVRLDETAVRRGVDRISAQPEPCSAWTGVSHSHMCERMRDDGCDVVVSGMGADDLFGGYGYVWHAYNSIVAHNETNPFGTTVDPLAWSMIDPAAPDDLFFGGVSVFTKPDQFPSVFAAPLKSLRFTELHKDFYRRQIEADPTCQPLSIATAHECQHRIPEVLNTSFKPGLDNVSLESFYPFLRGEFPRLIGGLNSAQRLAPKDSPYSGPKQPLKRLASTLLPSEIIERPRAAFGAPIRDWFSMPSVSARMVDEIERGRLTLSNIIDERWLSGQAERVSTLRDSSSTRMTSAEAQHAWVAFTLCTWANRWLSAKSTAASA